MALLLVCVVFGHFKEIFLVDLCYPPSHSQIGRLCILVLVVYYKTGWDERQLSTSTLRRSKVPFFEEREKLFVFP